MKLVYRTGFEPAQDGVKVRSLDQFAYRYMVKLRFAGKGCKTGIGLIASLPEGEASRSPVTTVTPSPFWTNIPTSAGSLSTIRCESYSTAFGGGTYVSFGRTLRPSDLDNRITSALRT